jgi:N-acetylglucosamine-6-phosphate deacetylase
VKIVTLAPELEGSLETIAELQKQNIIASMGHTGASFEQGISGVRSGASMITHMFNAMTAFHHRDPGLIGLLGAEFDDRPYYG